MVCIETTQRPNEPNCSVSRGDSDIITKKLFFSVSHTVIIRPLLQWRKGDFIPVMETRRCPDENVEHRFEIMVVHMHWWIRPKEIDCHEWLRAHTLFRRRALNVCTYSEIDVIQNSVYLVAFLAKHYVV